ncbi:MAG: DUF465 domain-containing protein [Hyphomicrobiaceae bacterium]|nr:MAG: DUF465 domain-containing protein [Hyphomicrobiaceae bacterium]
MGVSARLQELSTKHQALKRMIEEEAGRPGSDHAKIAELKRQKLKLKDEIAKLSPDGRH